MQVPNKERMTLHYNTTNKHIQTRQHLTFVHTLYKITNALINALSVLDYKRVKMSPLPQKTSTLQQLFKERAKQLIITHKRNWSLHPADRQK